MKFGNKLNLLIGTLLLTNSALVLANNGQKTRAEVAAENIDAISSASGGAAYSVSLALGIILIVVSIGAWVWSSREGSPQGNGKGKLVIISAIAGVALTFPAAWITFFGESVNVVDANKTVNYRQLENQQSNQ